MSNQVILVTGASRGLGLAITKALLHYSVETRLVLVARNTNSIEILKSEFPDQIEIVTGDLGNQQTASLAVETAIARFGRLDNVIINHGVLEPVLRLEETDIESWRSTFDINFFSAVVLIKEAIPQLRTNNGRAIFISSGAAETPYQAWGAYGSSKACINHLAQTLAAEEDRITSIAIRPGVMDTKMQQDIREKHEQQMGSSYTRFQRLKEEKKLLSVEKPGLVIAKLVLNAKNNLTGKFMNWNAEELAEYQ